MYPAACRLPPFSRSRWPISAGRSCDRPCSGVCEEVAGQLGRRYPLVINNQALESQATIESLNPSHFRQVVGRCAAASVNQAEQAVAAAQAAFPAWRDTPAAERAQYLFRAADVMRRRRFELAAWEVYECGKQWREADADVAESIDYCDYYGREMLRLGRATPPGRAGRRKRVLL